VTQLARPVPRLALNRIEVAAAIGISPVSVDVMVSEGALPPPRQWHSRKIWLVAEVEAYLTELPQATHAHAKEQAAQDDDEDWTPEL
jgi:predicted DNA-binding transcriptional regulator AlpA